jgi:pimeloyl-ACP methyl ester carboxylesterase
MLGIPNWFGTNAAETAVSAALRLAVSSGARGVAGDIQGSVVFDDGTGNPWTVHAAAGALSLERGADRSASTRVTGDPLTLTAVIRGHRGATEAFMRGRLKVRGNLALALKLDGIFERRQRPSDRIRPRRTTAAGIDTFYLEAGSGPPVVLLHGLGATNASMLPTFMALSRRHRVLAPDLPGPGDSGKPRGAYDAPFFARWLTAFLDATECDSAHLVGNSMGGRVALEMALVAEHRVERLVLLAPSLAFRRFRQAAPLVRLLSPEMGVVPVPLLRPYVRHSIQSLFVRPSRLDAAWHDSATDEFLRVFAEPRGRVALFAAARQIYLEKPFGPDGFWNRLPSLRVPSLFVWGSGDRMVPAAFSRHVQRALPEARSVVLPDCGHIPQFECASVTNRMTAEFLAAHGEAGGRVSVGAR